MSRYALSLCVLCISAICLFLLSLLTGPAAIGLPSLWGQLTDGAPEQAILIMREVRLPRACLAVLVGGALGLSGAVMQGFLRNPLAEPGVIGISSAASLGAVIALYTGLSLIAPLALPVFAIGGALAAAAVLFVLAGRKHTLSIILAGVALSSLCGALTALILNLSPNPYASYEIVFWLLGSLTDRSMDHVWLAAPFILVGAGIMLSTAKDLDRLSLGEEAAIGMGVDLKRLRLLAIGGTALAVGAATAVSGVIGFIGLVVPHLLRPLAGHRPSALLPLSAVGGAVVLLAADVLVRVVTPDVELKIGVLTSLLGAPFFLALVLRERAR